VLFGSFWIFLTGVLHANFERICWVPVFTTIYSSSDGVSILDLKGSFDSGVAGGDVRGYKRNPKSFDLSKIQAKSLKIWKKSCKFGLRYFDTFVLIVWWMRLTVEIRLDLTFFFSVGHMNTFCVAPKKSLNHFWDTNYSGKFE